MSVETKPADDAAPGGAGEFPHGIIEPVRDSVVETMAMFLGDSPEYQGADRDRSPLDAVVGILPFVGDPDFSLHLGIPRDTAVSLALHFAGFEIEFDSADMGDVVGELANVLAGDIRARLDEIGRAVHLGLPSVVRGHEVEVIRSDQQASATLAFKCSDGEFWLDLVSGPGE